MQRPMRVCVCVGTVNEQKWRPRPTLSLTMRKWARLCRNCQSWWMSSQLARGSGQSRTCVTTTMLCMCIASPAFLGADASSHSACRAQAEDMTRQKQARSAHMMPKSSVFDPAWQVKTGRSRATDIRRAAAPLVEFVYHPPQTKQRWRHDTSPTTQSARHTHTHTHNYDNSKTKAGTNTRFRCMPTARALSNFCSTNGSCSSCSPNDMNARSDSTKGRCRRRNRRCTRTMVCAGRRGGRMKQTHRCGCGGCRVATWSAKTGLGVPPGRPEPACTLPRKGMAATQPLGCKDR